MGHQLGDIELDVFCAETKGAQVLQGMPDFGPLEHCLGGNAAPVQADAAQVLLLDQRGAEPQLCGANSRDIATGAAADDDHIKFIGHGRS